MAVVWAVSLFADDEAAKEADFRKNLSLMLSKVDASIRILRQQIVVNQNAPFLADLYLQLGELLSQRANSLYYIEMEKQNKTETTSQYSGRFKAVAVAQREAIDVFQKILKEFPEFNKRGKVLHLLGLSLHSLGQIPEFIQVLRRLEKEYPKTQEVARGRLLMGQYFLDKRSYREAYDAFKPVAESQFVYEKNLARYRIGLIFIQQEKWDSALKAFELVVTDESLSDKEGPETVSLKSKGVKSSLKAEALTDSVRAYTNVFKKNPDPVTYYEKICPTEFLFQEVIQKLAYRYIYLKQYQVAVKLLRTLSERIVEPQKIVNIYQEVLLTIPLDDRIGIPIDEMQFLIEKYSQWVSFYKVPEATQKEAYYFLEKQVRDLGTRNHELGKTTGDASRRKTLLSRSKDYYHLYLGFFKAPRSRTKIATNLADVYYLDKDYIHAAEYYLRVFSGEFGVAQEKRQDILKNAIASAEQKKEYSFFEQIRARGLLIRGLSAYLASSPQIKKDDRVNFLLVKARYEQGLYTDALDNLLGFMKRFPGSKYAADAGELILDYFNTQGDFTGLSDWAKKILQVPLADKAFLKKVAKVKEQAQTKELHEVVKQQREYDAFEMGKSYLVAALNFGDRDIASTALRHALEKSKEERDVDTFLEAARLLGSKEKDQKKRLSIWSSLVKENLRVTRYYGSLKEIDKLRENKFVGEKDRVSLLDQAVTIALLLRDWEILKTYVEDRLWMKLPATTRQRVKQQVMDLLESPADVPAGMVGRVVSSSLDVADLLPLYKAQFRVSPSVRSIIQRAVTNACANKKNQRPVCRWRQVPEIDKKWKALEEHLRAIAATVDNVEKEVQRFMSVIGQYSALEGSGDPQLDAIAALRAFEVYRALAEFLQRVGIQNSEFKDVLLAKSKESAQTAARFLIKCQGIVKRAALLTSVNKYCEDAKSPTFEKLLVWGDVDVASPNGKDSTSGNVQNLERDIFVATKSGEPLLTIAKTYYDDEYFNHASASASYGMSLYPSLAKSFEAVLGCSLIRIGLLNEARYHIQQSEDYSGLKKQCLKELEELERKV